MVSNGRAAVLAGFLLAGCGAGGAEVRTTIPASSWTPSVVVVAAPAMSGDAVVPPGNLPAGIGRPTAEDAKAAVFEALRAALASSATSMRFETSFSSSLTGAGAGEVARRYLERREVDRAAARALTEEGGPDGVLLTALLKYGPEAEADTSTQAGNVNTTVGTTAVGISSAATRVMVWYNAQLRCALVRLSDGAVVWDAAVRRRRKQGLVREVSQESVLGEAVAELARAFPWAAHAEEQEVR